MSNFPCKNRNPASGLSESGKEGLLLCSFVKRDGIRFAFIGEETVNGLFIAAVQEHENVVYAVRKADRQTARHDDGRPNARIGNERDGENLIRPDFGEERGE